MPYRVTKTYPHSLGLSACFRQWRADSHCNLLHGYALAFTLTFEADTLDDRNWVIDFGSLKPVKEFLVRMFDHRLLVAADDPDLPLLMELGYRKVADIEIVNAVGCEAFAKLVADYVHNAILNGDMRVRLVRVTCAEHEGNAATWVAA